MKVYLGQTRSGALIRKLNSLGFGEMTQPKEVPPRRRPFALDNYAFACFKNDVPWRADIFMEACDECYRARDIPDFVVVPDMVARGLESLQFSVSWLKFLNGFAPKYLAVQDGMVISDVTPHLKDFDGLFVGGSSEWKMESGFWWVSLAHALGKPCHIGRISGRKRTRLVKSWGADSIDSCVPLWSEDNLNAVLYGLQDPVDRFVPVNPEFLVRA